MTAVGVAAAAQGAPALTALSRHRSLLLRSPTSIYDDLARLALATGSTGAPRGALLGIATGLLYALTAALLKAVSTGGPRLAIEVAAVVAMAAGIWLASPSRRTGSH